MASIFNQHRAPQLTAAPPRYLVDAWLGICQDEYTTCGWANNVPAPGAAPTGMLELECSPGWGCAHNTIIGAEGCCPFDQPITDCVFQTTCYGYGNGPESLPADATSCTDINFPNCAGVILDGGTSFICAEETSVLLTGTPNPDIPPIPASATATGAASSVTFTPVENSPVLSPSLFTSLSAIPSTSSTQATTRVQPVAPASSTPNSASSQRFSGGLSVGAIVSIAIGGVAVILGLL